MDPCIQGHRNTGDLRPKFDRHVPVFLLDNLAQIIPEVQSKKDVHHISEKPHQSSNNTQTQPTQLHLPERPKPPSSQQSYEQQQLMNKDAKNLHHLHTLPFYQNLNSHSSQLNPINNTNVNVSASTSQAQQHRRAHSQQQQQRRKILPNNSDEFSLDATMRSSPLKATWSKNVAHAEALTQMLDSLLIPPYQGFIPEEDNPSNLNQPANSRATTSNNSNNDDCMMIPVDFSQHELAYQARNIEAGITLRRFETDLINHEIASRSFLRDSYARAHHQNIRNIHKTANILTSSYNNNNNHPANVTSYNSRPYIITGISSNQNLNENQNKLTTQSFYASTYAQPNQNQQQQQQQQLPVSSKCRTESSFDSAAGTTSNKNVDKNNNDSTSNFALNFKHNSTESKITTRIANTKGSNRHANQFNSTSKSSSSSSTNNSYKLPKEANYQKDTFSNSMHSYDHRNTRHQLLFGKPMKSISSQSRHNTDSSNEKGSDDYLRKYSEQLPVKRQVCFTEPDELDQGGSAMIGSNGFNKGSQSSQQTRRTELSVAPYVSKENKVKFKESLKRLDHFSRFLATKYEDNFDERNPIEPVDASRVYSFASAHENKSVVLQKRVKTMLREKHIEVSDVLTQMDHIDHVQNLQNNHNSDAIFASDAFNQTSPSKTCRNPDLMNQHLITCNQSKHKNSTQIIHIFSLSPSNLIVLLVISTNSQPLITNQLTNELTYVFEMKNETCLELDTSNSPPNSPPSNQTHKMGQLQSIKELKKNKQRVITQPIVMTASQNPNQLKRTQPIISDGNNPSILKQDAKRTTQISSNRSSQPSDTPNSLNDAAASAAATSSNHQQNGVVKSEQIPSFAAQKLKALKQIYIDSSTTFDEQSQIRQELQESVVESFNVDKSGKLQMRGIKEQRTRWLVPRSQEQIKKRVEYFKDVLISFLKKCVKMKINSMKASDGNYFNSQPFKRPGSYVLFIALKDGNLDIFNSMLKQDPEFIYESDHTFSNCLHIAIQKRLRNVAITLIHMGIDIDQRDAAGKTPLYYALKLNSFDIAKYLLFRRVSPWKEPKCKYAYEKLTNNAIMLRCIRKAKQADVCAQMSLTCKKKQWTWKAMRLSLYTDSECKIIGDSDCLTGEESEFIRKVIK